MSETNPDYFAHGDSFPARNVHAVLPVPPIVLTLRRSRLAVSV